MIKKRTHQQPDGELLKILQDYLLAPEVTAGTAPAPSRDPDSLAEYLQTMYPKYKRTARPALRMLVERTLPYVPPIVRVATPQPSQSPVPVPASGSSTNNAIDVTDEPPINKDALNNSLSDMYKKSTSPEPLVNNKCKHHQNQKIAPPNITIIIITILIILTIFITFIIIITFIIFLFYRNGRRVLIRRAGR